jgi:hypothetical protein
MQLSLGGGQALQIYPNNMLFSVLAAQLAALATSSGIDKVARCSVCGDLFEAIIRPGRHERTFCSKLECRLEGERDRKRRWARKTAAAKRAKSTS